jgi:DNA-directed RNA polymerase specialized sigma24 family protein
MRGGGQRAIDLVHEACFRLFQPAIDWRDKSHFLAPANILMGRLLADRARAAKLRSAIAGCATRTIAAGVNVKIR